MHVVSGEEAAGVTEREERTPVCLSTRLKADVLSNQQPQLNSSLLFLIMRRSQTTRSSHRPSNSGSAASELGVVRDGTGMTGSTRGRSSMDTAADTVNRSAAYDTSMSFSSGRRRRDGSTSVLDLSTKFESDELEENPVVGQMRVELRDAQKEIERVSITSTL